MIYSVGSLYHSSRTQWPECAQYNYRSGAHELLLFYGAPSTDEVDAVRTGEAKFALHVHGPLIVLLYKLGGRWSDAPYSWHLLPASERDLPSADLASETRANLQVVLVDATTGIVRAIRLLSLSPPFTRALHAAIRAQAAHPWSEPAYDRALAALYRRYPTSADLAKAAQHQTRGGE